MASDTELIIRLRADVDRLRKDLGRAKGQMNSFRSFGKSFARDMTASLGITFGAFAVGAAIKSSIEKIAGFEFQMDKVAAVSRASAEEVKALEQNALDLGASTKFTASEIGKMQEEIARLGFTVPKILATTDAVRKLATVADAELGESAKVMVGTLNAFNLSAEESERVANVMAESFSMSALDLEKFQVAISNVGAAGKAMGFTLEAVTAMVGSLVDANVDASKAGTDLRQIFIRLTEHGLTYDEAMQRIRDSTDKVATANKLFGDRAFNSAIILSQQEEKVKKLTEAFSDENKELNKMVKVMEDNLITDWALFTSAIDGVIQKGGALNSFFRESVQFMTQMVVALQNIDLVLGTVFKSFDKLTDQEIFRLVDAGMVTESGQNVKELLKPLIEAPVEDIAANFQQIRSDIISSLVASGESTKQATKLFDAYFNIFNQTKGLFQTGPQAIQPVVVAINKTSDAAADAGMSVDELAEAMKKFKRETHRVVGFDDFFSFGGFTGRESGAFTVPEPKLKLRDNPIANLYAKQFEAAKAEIQMQTDALNAVLEDSIESGIAGFAEGLGTGGLEDAFKNLLEVIGGGLINLGKSLIAYGVAVKAFKEALTKNPIVAIAAGAAAIAAGALVKQAASNMGSVSSSGGSGGGGGGGFQSNGIGGQTGINFPKEIKLRAEGKELVGVIRVYGGTEGRLRG